MGEKRCADRLIWPSGQDFGLHMGLPTFESVTCHWVSIPPRHGLGALQAPTQITCLRCFNFFSG
jgi:hypothetical protein